jgi:hypothetical protein
VYTGAANIMAKQATAATKLNREQVEDRNFELNEAA